MLVPFKFVNVAKPLFIDAAVTTPLTFTLPTTDNLEVGFVVPNPRLPDSGINDNWDWFIFVEVEPIPAANNGYTIWVVFELPTTIVSLGIVLQVGGRFIPLEIKIWPSSPAVKSL